MRPLVGVCGSRDVQDGVPSESVRCRYIEAVRSVQAVNGEPVLIPLHISDRVDCDDLLARLDGLLLCGDPSNVHPSRYGTPPITLLQARDPARDASALAFIPRAIDLGVPLLGICRGIQEMNVAFGGDLIQDLSATSSGILHHEDETLPRDDQYRPCHEIELVGQTLRRIVGRDRVSVNSLHHQGIGTLAPTLRIEAVAADGLVEAVSVIGAEAFALGVQWHPEWYFDSDPVSMAIFNAFGTACAYRQRDRATVPTFRPIVEPDLQPWDGAV